MALAQAMPMPTFVARCLEEIGLEGRCGLPVRDMFALVDDVGDLVYRRYAWKVLRAMGDQVTFHYMLRSEEATAAMSATSVQHTKASAKSSNGAEGAVRREKRRRKWSTTLMHVDEGNDQHAASRSTTGEDAQGGSHRRRRRRRRLDSTGSDCVVQQEQEEMQEQEEEEEERDRGQDDREGDESQHGQEGTEQEADISVTASSSSRSRSSGDPSSRSRGGTTDSSVGSSSKTSDEDKKRRRWITRSPRGYELGEELDVTGLSYEDAISETPEGVLGIVACEELRLKYLGVVDPSVMDTASPQFDLLEMIGRAREEGLNAAHVTESRMFGDARKLHYLLDMLIASGFAVKNIISADQKRFNILHLTRFAARFHPSMISPTATLERDGFPKDKLPHLIAQILVSRGERTCVFADIGREFGYSKRHQEKLRKYFFHQMHIDADFPLELFMARCNTGSDSKGRKLWCVRVKSTGRVGKTSDRGGREHESGEGPVLERGIMEQVFSSIQERGDEGATIPEIRDVLGVPTFKLPYKLAQGLISNYNLGVEQVVLGKSTMYRMFAPGVVKSEPELLTLEAEMERVVSEGHNTEDKRDLNGDGTCSGNAEEVNQETLYQPSTLKEATRGLVVTSTVDRRRQYILDRVGKEKIVSIHQLRSGLVEAERLRGKPAADVGQIDIRSVRRIVDELETAKAVVTVDITLPPKRVLQKSHKVLKCVALPDAQRDRDVLRQFIDNYLEEQQRRFMENMDHENDAFIVVSNRSARRKSRKNNPQPIPSSIENREVVKYTAASYKMARVNLVKLHKQGRRLGMFFGVIYRCKALHLLLWDRVPRLQRQQQEVSDTVGEDDNSSPRSNKLVFGLKEILDMLSVREYIQIVGVSELLTEAEENKVRMAIVRGDSWEALTLETCEKIRACEADRFSKLLRVLIELGLLHVVNESSYDLLSAMRRSTEDFDQVISHVAFATLSGGLFELRKDAHISLKRGSKPVKQLPNKNSYVYAAGFTGNNRGEQVTGRIPLDFAFDDTESVSEYWKTLQFLSLEGARLGNGETESTSVSVNVDAEPLRPVPLRDHNLFVMKVWVPRATTNYRAQAERAKAVADVVDQETKLILKRKRFQSSLHSGRVSGRSEKVQRKALKQMFSSAYEEVDTSEGTREATASRWRQLDGWGGARSRIRAAKWSPDDDMKLMDLYIEKLSTLWFIDVPLALQKGTERVAFRSTKLSRTKILWKLVADVLGRKREDCILRVRELLSVPAVQARVEKTKQAITRAKNPGGQFHEELEIISQPRLTSLLCRALQIVFHEGSSYYSVLADMLISAHWREAEVKLVWRYLWLSRVISRTTKANQGEKQRQRGFGMHAHVFETKSLQIPHYSIEFFCDAAEYASFLQQNVKEAEFTDDDGNADSVFERDIEQNAPGGQIAVDLTALLLKEAAYVPEYTHTAMSEGTDGESCSVSFSPPKKIKSSPTLQESKRSLAIKGFAGHLSKKFDGAQPDDFLKDFWSVKGRYGLSGASDGDFMSSDHLGWTRAFSSCDHTDSTHPAKLSSANVASTMKWLLELIESKGPDGLTLTQVKSNFQGDEMVLNRAVEHALGKRSCIEVNGAEASRLVSIKHARMWTLKPYRVATDSTEENVHFVFEKNRSIVSHPWLHLDGSTNSKVLLMFKRRLVNIVMCSPGIPDRLIHQKMNRALTLQETRCLLDELVKDEVLYGRVTRHDRRFRSPVSIFDVGSRKPDQVVLFSITPGQLRNVDNVRDALFYFPSVNCVELLGAEASDVDLGRTE